MHTRRRGEQPGRAHRREYERGSAAAQLVILTPVILLFLAFFYGIGSLTHASALVADAAAQAARAATLNYLDPGQATAAAQQAATAALAEAGLSCASDTVSVDTGDDRPGGSITVHLACNVSLAQAIVAGFPGSETLTASFTSPIDVYVPGN
jgi:Flp pilus assembly protein TadG